MILSRSTSSVILFGLLQALAQTPNVGAAPHDPKLSNRAGIESIENLGNEAASVIQRVWQGISCSGDCRPHWGWTGKHFGSDPWGAVVLKGDPVPYSDSESDSDGNNSSQSVGADSYNTLSNGGTGGVTTAPTSTVVFSVYNVPTLSSTLPSSTSFSSSLDESFTASSTSSSSSSQEPTPTPTPETTSNPPEQQVTTPVDNQGNGGQGGQDQQNQDSSDNNSNQDGSNSGNFVPNPDIGSNSVSGDEQSQYLQAHNDFRAKHGASSLTWSDQLAGFAQEWANNCQFQHSAGKFGRVGENLAAGTGNYGIAEMVTNWTDEAPNYNPNNPQASHFTQVVWKDTTQVGCAKATCGGIFSEGGSATFYVCEYSAAGNVIGQFARNVQ